MSGSGGNDRVISLRKNPPVLRNFVILVLVVIVDNTQRINPKVAKSEFMSYNYAIP